jgi:NTE family protein
MKSSRIFGSLSLLLSALLSMSAAWSQTVDSTQTTTPASPPAAAKQRPRIGLALGGGGARGAAEVGVLQVFKEEGVPIDMIAGTSIGSVIGGLYDAGVSIDELATKFNDSAIMKAFMPIPISMRIVLAPVIFVPRLLGAKPYDGLYKGKIFTKFANSLARSETQIEKLPIPFAAVCTNLVDGKAYRITKGNLGIAMDASTAVPGLKKPVQIGDNLYCDGGLVDNVPVKQVREMGADFVIAVDIDEALNPIPLNDFRKPGSVSKQALRIQLASQDIPACAAADFVIHPDTNGISLISRKSTDGRRGIQSGIDAARAAMPELKSKLAAIGITVNPQTSISVK